MILGIRLRSSRNILDSDAAAAIGDAFRQYIEAKRTFIAVYERCTLKGWPDLTAVVQHDTKFKNLVIQSQTLRFNHLLGRIPVEDPVWESLDSVLSRLENTWTDNDEANLSTESEEYRRVSSELALAEAALKPETLAEARNAAVKDPEWRDAADAFRIRHCAIDEKLKRVRRVPGDLNRGAP